MTKPVGADLRGAYALVPQQLLHGSDAHTLIERFNLYQSPSVGA